MARILSDYESVSGQQVNLQKSSIIFGMKIAQSHRQLLMRILRITTVGGGGKYLGLPEQFARTKVDGFQHLVDNVASSIDGWYNRYLSPAGKEVLIKSIAQSKPVYAMSCFLIPKSVCSAIDRMLSAFWWGTNESGCRKISWVSWKRLSLPKREGGLGFKDLHCFNLALLAKQAWRILQNPSSLLAQLYKGRYYPSHGFLESRKVPSGSYGWNSIQEGKSLLKHGLLTRLGNGETTKVWSDFWIPVLPLRVPQGPITNPELLVKDLLKPGMKEWDMTALSVLAPEDIDLVKQIRLSRFADVDTVVWAYNDHTNYTVKSGYWVATHILQAGEAPIPPHGSISLKYDIWRLPIPPKLQHFLWRVVTEALPTADRLLSKTIHLDPTCQRCCLEAETINHLLFGCQYAVAVWRCSNLRLFDNASVVLTDNVCSLLRNYKTSSLSDLNRVLPFYIVWFLWKSQNELLFQHHSALPQDTAMRGFNTTAEWLSARVLMSPTSSLLRPCVNDHCSEWEPPPKDWLKCNFDGTFRVSADFIGVGWLVRDANGTFVEAGWAKLPKVQSALQSEASAFLYVLQHIWSRGWRMVWFESDCKVLTDLFNGGLDHLDVGSFLLDIRHWAFLLPWCSLASANRERNSAADCLANRVYLSQDLCMMWHIPPLWLFQYLYYPYTV